MATEESKRARHVNATKQTLALDVIAKRTKRHLEELERSNYTEPSITLDDNDEGAISGKNRVRQIVSDKRHLNDPNAKKKKSSMKVRTALLYRKNLATLIEESAPLAHSKSSLPRSNIFNSCCSSPSVAPRLLCSVCGYKGAYRCKKCAMPYCDMNCESVHTETRCERRVI